MPPDVYRDPPAAAFRRRVSARFRGRLFDRCRDGAAHAEVARDEHTTRYQAQRAYLEGGDELLRWREARPPRRLSLDEAYHRRIRSSPPSSLTLTDRRAVEVLDGRSRRVVHMHRVAPRQPDIDTLRDRNARKPTASQSP